MAVIRNIGSNLKVKKAESWDYLKGWVRISCYDRDKLPRNTVCKISREGKVVRRAVLGTNNRGVIQMDLDTRLQLGVDVDIEYDFEIQPLARWKLCEWHLYLWNHPDTGARIGYKLGVLTTILGIIGGVLLGRLLSSLIGC